jgi:hypothetical protein
MPITPRKIIRELPGISTNQPKILAYNFMYAIPELTQNCVVEIHDSMPTS